MRCPKCSYMSFDYHDECPKCGKNWADLKEGKTLFLSRPQKIGVWEYYEKEKAGELEPTNTEMDDGFPIELNQEEESGKAEVQVEEKGISSGGDDVDLSSLGFDFGKK